MDISDEKLNEILVSCKLTSGDIKTFKQEIKDVGYLKVYLIAAKYGHINVIKEIKKIDKKNELPWDERICSAAALAGNTATLKQLRGALQCKWDAETFKNAAEGCSKAVLVFLKASGCPSDYRTTDIAAEKGYFKILKWAISNTCEWRPEIWPILFTSLLQKKEIIKLYTNQNKSLLKAYKDKNQIERLYSTDDNYDDEFYNNQGNWAFKIFLWAGNSNLIDDKDRWIVKVVKFIERIPSIMKVRKLRENRSSRKIEIIKRSWDDVIKTTDTLATKKIKPLYWDTVYSRYLYHMEETDNSDVYKNDDQIIKMTEEQQEEVDDNEEQNEILAGRGETRLLENYNYDPEELRDSAELDDGYRQQLEENVSNGTLELTKQVMNWYSEVDKPYQKMLLDRLYKIINGMETYSVAKPLKGMKRVRVVEAKLDSGMRILWTKVFPAAKDYVLDKVDPNDENATINDGDDHMKPRLLIWYVSKHDKVPHYMDKIEKSVGRLGITNPENFTTHLIQKQVLVDPSGNSFMKVYMKAITILKEEMDCDETPKFAMRLTRREKQIRNQGSNNSIMVFGRSGTGKTICLTDKMRHDRQLDSSITQLFVARSKSLCKLVKSYQQNSDTTYQSYKGKFSFMTFNDFVNEMCRKVAGRLGQELKYIFKSEKRVTNKIFKEEIWNEIKHSCNLADNIVWTQIHSCLKGSVEVIVKKAAEEGGDFVTSFKYLTLEEYMNESDFSYKRTKLTQPQKNEAYKAFERYQKYLGDKGLWDDSDKALFILQNCEMQKMFKKKYGTNFNFTQMENEQALYFYDKVYIDEIQDFTQTEILLFFVAAGMNSTLFMVGDTAQAVEEAVSFRFEEIRGLVHKICGGEPIPKPLKLDMNFRSHKGILNLGAAVVDKLKLAFRESNELLIGDTGLVNGPAPAVIPDITAVNESYKQKSTAKNLYEQSVKVMKELVELYPHAVFLTPSDNLDRLTSIVGSNKKVLSIVQSKGLEFTDVVIVDFFSCIPPSDRQHWKRLFTLKQGETLGDFFHPTAEFQLKNLYVGITRARDRLVFIETGLFDKNDNGEGFEIVHYVWKSWSRVGTNNGALIQNFNLGETFKKQKESDRFMGALENIQQALNRIDDGDGSDYTLARSLFTLAYDALKSCTSQEYLRYLPKLETQQKIFSDDANEIGKSIKFLQESLEKGLFDSSVYLLKKLAGIDDEDYQGDTSTEDVASDYYDSDTQVEKVIKDNVINKLIQSLNAIINDDNSTIAPSSTEISTIMKDFKAYQVHDTLEDLKKLRKAIKKKVKRKIQENRKKKRVDAEEEKKKIEERLPEILKKIESKKKLFPKPSIDILKNKLSADKVAEKQLANNSKLQQFKAKDVKCQEVLNLKKEAEKAKKTEQTKKAEQDRAKVDAANEKARRADLEKARRDAEQEKQDLRDARKAEKKAKKATGGGGMPGLKDIDSDSSYSGGSSSDDTSDSDAPPRPPRVKKPRGKKGKKYKDSDSDSDSDDSDDSFFKPKMPPKVAPKVAAKAVPPPSKSNKAKAAANDDVPPLLSSAKSKKTKGAAANDDVPPLLSSAKSKKTKGAADDDDVPPPLSSGKSKKPKVADEAPPPLVSSKSKKSKTEQPKTVNGKPIAPRSLQGSDSDSDNY